MCGIFSLVATSACKIPNDTIYTLVQKIFELSESRGKDASGFLSVLPDEIKVLKTPHRARTLLKTDAFANLLNEALAARAAGNGLVLGGHTRMVTNGSETDPNNNQPVLKDGHVLLHNGIIVNDGALWDAHPDLRRAYAVDTEVFAAILAAARTAGQSFPAAMARAFAEARGANTLAVFGQTDRTMLVGTTNGSLYYWGDDDKTLALFSSERVIVEQILKSLGEPKASFAAIRHLAPRNMLRIDLDSAALQTLSFDDAARAPAEPQPAATRKLALLDTGLEKDPPRATTPIGKWTEIEKLMEPDSAAVGALKRCAKCLLPETFPFIQFDSDGVCQFCNTHTPRNLQGAGRLDAIASSFRSGSDKQDCLVPISGGRDSCFGLHYTKKVLGLNPVAYTYDWGFVTDLARRNISRMCEALEVEHVLIAANIKQKRENVRKNVTAWLNRPQLGMIPLFMAGDKMFFYYASMLRRQMRLGPILFSMNWLEKTGFKAGFAGVNDTASHDKTYGLTNINKAKLFGYYAKEFLMNPGYLNGSLPDTAFGFLSYYLQAKDYYSLFDFLPWEGDTIETTLRGTYDWEVSPDTVSTWRIGDGTAPFYNYIYYTVSGFSEHDTFRSNQIREGLMTRAEALALIEQENRPRVDSFVWYCDTIGIDPVGTVKRINAIPRLYRRS